MEEKKSKHNKRDKYNAMKPDLIVSSFDFRKIFEGRKVPLVNFDERWLTIFPKENMTDHMKELCLKVTDLLKKQSKAVEEIKGYKRYKEQLMQEIMENMDTDESFLGRLKARKLEKNQKLILELNAQLQKAEDELAELPNEIKQVNEELLIETTRECFQQLIKTDNQVNLLKDTIKEYEDRLHELKEEVKDIEKTNREIYLYMHDMLGPDMMKRIDDQLS
jgi:DNA repair exonuclease SbcCD ATPase subunit